MQYKISSSNSNSNLNKKKKKTHQTIESNPLEKNSATNQDHKHRKTQQLFPSSWIAKHEQRRIVEWKLPIWRMMKGVCIGKMKRDSV